MKRFYPIVLFFLFSLSTYAGGKQNTDVNQQQDTQAIGISGANVNQNFEAAKPQAQVPQFGINSSGSAVPLFSTATRTADQLFEAYEAAQDALGLDRTLFLTEPMLKEMELGVRQTRELAFVSFSPKPDFMREKYLAGNRPVTQGQHTAFPVPRFVKKLNITGEYLGEVYVSSLPGIPATDGDLQNGVAAFVHENISTYFPGKKLYLVNIPNGAGINVGVSTESLAKGLFGSLGSPLGAMSGALGGSVTQNSGDTRYSTTLGRQILVFVDKGAVPIRLDFTAPSTEEAVNQEPQATPTTPQNTQEVVVRVKVETSGNNNVPMKQKEGYTAMRPRNHNYQQQQRYTINE